MKMIILLICFAYHLISIFLYFLGACSLSLYGRYYLGLIRYSLGRTVLPGIYTMCSLGCTVLIVSSGVPAPSQNWIPLMGQPPSKMKIIQPPPPQRQNPGQNWYLSGLYSKNVPYIPKMFVFILM